MNLSELRTIVDIMSNEAPDGRVEMVHVVRTRYAKTGKTTESGRWQPDVIRDGTVPRGVCVDVLWHREGRESKLVGKFRTVNSGFPADVQLEQIKGGIVDRYVSMIRWFSA